MTQEHEPEWMRDKRLRDEESRMVLLETNVAATRVQADAIHEMFVEERKLRRAAEEALLKHETDDASKFASIDNRLQGIQNQLTSISSTTDRTENRLKVLEDANLGRTAITRWLQSAWVQLGIGAGVGSTLVALYALIA